MLWLEQYHELLVGLLLFRLPHGLIQLHQHTPQSLRHLMMLASKARFHHQHQLRPTLLHHLLRLQIHQGVHHVQTREQGWGRVDVVVRAVGEELGDVVDLDGCYGPNLQRAGEDGLGMY